MKTLILMRHAKSSWDDLALPDHERPLNSRGRRSATLLGDWLRAKGHLPDQVISSDSLRTRETFERLNLGMGAEFIPALYHADPLVMLSVLKQATGDSVLMLGHNPGIARFAADLVMSAPAHWRFAQYPTCATMVAQFELDHWSKLRWGAGKLIDFVIPRELPESFRQADK